MKEAFYFSHDSNARHDPKIIKLRMKLGWEGYGIYWGLIEILRDQKEYMMRLDYESISFALHTDCEAIKSIINDFDLFKVNDEFFYSESLLERMKIKDAKSITGKKAANIRWEKEKTTEKNAKSMQTHSDSNADAMQSQSIPNAIKESKVKESKNNTVINVNEIHETVITNLAKSEIWIEVTAKNAKREIHEIKLLLNEFKDDCIVRDNLKENESEAKNHFANWLLKKSQADKVNELKPKYALSTIKDNDF